MPISANDTKRKSWLEVAQKSDFPIQNIPFVFFLKKKMWLLSELE
jgi:fumarylacetoacetase